ncbi:patatin-like phospholipase family protein [Deefgea rivuli]|uniref:patatin-like phospholipase family protein n=1 Tax=Deefgea rivuli TaxID=400948 RepID=UPI00056B59B4|nr:patatin-like phospholipase family protein [Deefgea rivuli]
MAVKKRKIAITCQGGGSQTAFTAGALKALYDNGFSDHYELVSITGTSGGALCATLIWYAMLKKDAYIPQRMLDLWADNTAQSDAELRFNDYLIDSMRKVNSGKMPQFNISPYSPLMQMMSTMTNKQFRPNFTDFRGLLEAHIDFAELKAMGANTELPALILGAAEVLTGQLAKFNSRTEAIRVEHILSSCAVPNIFEAVEFDGKAYWDGLFSDNPPVDEVIMPMYVGENNLPDEIWVIKINPNGCKEVPRSPEAISDRRNEMIGNMSLFQQLNNIRTLNELLLNNAFTPEFLEKNGVKAAINMPRGLSNEVEERAYHIPFIEMSEALQSKLDCESKLDRSPKNIQPLMNDGEVQATAFIKARIAALKA